jgi:integrase/recombinase XerD
MILVAFWHGLRASEVVSFTPDAVKDGFLTIQRLKGSMRTVQALPEHAEPLLNLRNPLIEYVRKSRPNQPVFSVTRVQFWRLFQRYARAAQIPAHKRHPHVLKHTIAALTIHSAGVENVRQRLGHKSMSSTGEYLKVSDEDASQAVTDAIKGL